MAASTIVAVAVKTVLVADDTAFVRDRFKTALEGAGHRALVVRTGAEVLAALRAEPGTIDLVVMDLRLTHGDGLRLLRSISKLEARPAIVVFSNTIASAEEVRALGALGVGGYINEYMAAQHIVPSLTPHLFPDRSNRRTGPRVVAGVPVSYRFGNTIAAALTVNISRGGLAIRTTSLLDIGTAVRVRFRLPVSKKEVDVDARVAWVDRRTGMGLEFLQVDDATRAALEEFVESHFFSNRKA